MPPVDTEKRSEPFRAYACGKHCSLKVRGRCCRALLVDMDRIGARLQFFDARSLSMVAGCSRLRMNIDHVGDDRLSMPLRCFVKSQEGGVVVVHFEAPLEIGLVEMQRVLGTAA